MDQPKVKEETTKKKFEKTKSKKEYWKNLRGVTSKTFWSTTDLGVILQVSKQRVHQLAKKYEWTAVNENPKIWVKDGVIENLPEILDRRKSLSESKLILYKMEMFGKFSPEDITKTVSILQQK